MKGLNKMSNFFFTDQSALFIIVLELLGFDPSFWATLIRPGKLKDLDEPDLYTKFHFHLTL